MQCENDKLCYYSKKKISVKTTIKHTMGTEKYRYQTACLKFLNCIIDVAITLVNNVEQVIVGCCVTDNTVFPFSLNANIHSNQLL